MNSWIWILLLLCCCGNNNNGCQTTRGNGRSYDYDDYNNYNGFNNARNNSNNGCGCDDDLQGRNFSGFSGVGTSACESNFDDNNNNSNQNNNQ